MNDCSQHKKEVAGISEMKELAEKVGDLHYEALAKFLYYLSDKIFHDGKKDSDAGRTQLSAILYLAQNYILNASKQMDMAAKICKPFMENKNQS